MLLTPLASKQLSATTLRRDSADSQKLKACLKGQLEIFFCPLTQKTLN